MLGLRSALKEDSNVSAAEVFFGKKLVLPVEFVPPQPPADGPEWGLNAPSSNNRL
jgi:hypothetical protein